MYVQSYTENQTAINENSLHRVVYILRTYFQMFMICLTAMNNLCHRGPRIFSTLLNFTYPFL